MKDREVVKWLTVSSKKQVPAVLLLAVLNMASAGLSIFTALYSKNVIDAAFSSFDRELLNKTLYFLALILLRLLLYFVTQNLQTIAGDRMIIELRARIMHVFMNMEYQDISNCHTGELMTRITSDVEIISGNVITLIPNVLQLLTRLVCAFLVLYGLDRKFSISILLLGSMLFLAIQPFRSLMKRMHKKVQEKEGKLRSFMQEILESQLVLRVFHVEEQAEKQMTFLQEESYRMKRKRRKMTITANTVIQMVFQLGYIYALTWSAYQLGKGAISVGTLTAVLQLVNQIQNPLMGMSRILPGIFAVLASAERLMELEKSVRMEHNVSCDSDKQNLSMPLQTLYKQMKAIEVQDVTFSYNQKDGKVLDHASLCLEKYDFATIVGHSGIGKSTLMKLLLGIYPLETGKIGIRLNNGCFYEMTEEMRRLYAYVPQGNFLFSGTIQETLCFFREGIRESDIWKALRISCAEEFVRALPDGLQTRLGERGLGLSEGQMQRLAIARALLSQAPILLLDEATSALDEETEYRLLENLRALKDRTCLFVTHRMAASRVCTKEIRVYDGKMKVKKL